MFVYKSKIWLKYCHQGWGQVQYLVYLSTRCLENTSTWTWSRVLYKYQELFKYYMTVERRDTSFFLYRLRKKPTCVIITLCCLLGINSIAARCKQMHKIGITDGAIWAEVVNSVEQIWCEGQ